MLKKDSIIEVEKEKTGEDEYIDFEIENQSMKKEGKKKKSRKIVRKILIGIFGVVILFLSGVKVCHEVMKNKERKELIAYGYDNFVEVDGKEIQIYEEKKNPSNQTIVYIQGLGMSDVNMATKVMFEQIPDYNVCIVNRAGNGLSSDTREERTIDRIVEEYRRSLQKNGNKPPYVLMAHSIGGMYASYWGSKYPDEVSSIIYIDCTPAECFVEQNVDFMTKAIGKLENVACNIGIQRLLSEESMIGEDKKGVLSKKEKEYALKLMYQNSYSAATYSEMVQSATNAKQLLERLDIEQIPKLYIKADRYSGEYYTSFTKESLKEQFNQNDKEINKFLEEKKKDSRIITEHMKKRGNITIKSISGTHTLYMYAPDEMADAVNAFLQSSAN